MRLNFSTTRIWALIIKEFNELVRDPFSLSIILFLPIVQSLLFIFAINDNPKFLPTVVVNADNSSISRGIVNDLEISSYFKILPGVHTPKEINHLFRSGKIFFAIYIPSNFTRDLIRGKKPEILFESDAISAATISYALSAINDVTENYFKKFEGPLKYLRTNPLPINVIIHPKFNPDRNTKYNTVPGTFTSVLSLTLVLMTALAIVRERENGTLEILLTTPLKPMEIILGKIAPYIFLGYTQILVLLFLSYYVFIIPINGSIGLLLFCCFPFIIANLALGIFISTFANNQLQAANCCAIYFTPSLMFSGFIFPFVGLPEWGKFIGYLLPSTHFLVIVRGIMLKGSTYLDIFPNILAILLMILVLIILTITRFHKTL